ncbi:MAG TPA: hypothetical protein VF429_10125 [Anaerolineae bacterium]
MEKLLRDRTSFVIAHRLSTIRNADQIIANQDGKVVERGKHEELLGKGGVYHDLYMSRFRHEVETALVPQGAGTMVAAK